MVADARDPNGILDIPTAADIGIVDSLFQNGWHRCVKGPRCVEDLHELFNVRQDMDVFRELERIDFENPIGIWVRCKNFNSLQAAEHLVCIRLLRVRTTIIFTLLRRTCSSN